MSDLSIFGVEYDDHPTRSERRRLQQRRRRRRRRSPLGLLLALLVIGGLVVGIVYGGRMVMSRFGSVPDYAGVGSGSVLVQVRPGETASDIAATLTEAGVVKSERAFREAAQADPRSIGIQPGYYRVHKQMSAVAALSLLLDPKARVMSRFTVPEGLSVAATLKIIAARTHIPLAKLQAAAKNRAALGLPSYAKGQLEGVLFPATYDLDPGTSPTEILRQMVGTYHAKVDEDVLVRRASALRLTPYQVLTVASLVEEEGVTADFPKIARVIYNRLAQGQRLQLDSTVNYALGRTRERVSLEDTDVESPYNTYRHAGLPPTAISNPGVEAIEAATRPAAGNWLYFVKADKSGRSYFTGDYQDFLRAKARAQAAGVY